MANSKKIPNNTGTRKNKPNNKGNKKANSKTTKVKTRIARPAISLYTELLVKNKSVKKLAGKLGINYRKLLKINNFYQRNSGPKLPDSEFFDKLAILVKKEKVNKFYKIKSSKTGLNTNDLLKVPAIRLKKGTRYLHLIFYMKFTDTTGGSFNRYYSQVVDAKSTNSMIRERAVDFIKSLSGLAYISEVELINFTITQF